MKHSITVPFDKAFISVPVGKMKIKESEYDPTGSIRIVDQGQKLISGYTKREDLLRDDGPYIVFGDHTRIFKYVDFPFVVGADGVRLYRAAEGFDPKFLFLFLKSIGLPEDGYGRHSKYLKELKAPKIELNLQRQIAARLKAQLAEVEKARNAVEAQLAEVSLLAARYRKNSTEKLKNAQKVPLGDLLLRIEAGKSLKTTEIPAKPDELGVLKVSAVSWNEFQPQEAKSIEGDYQPDERHRIKKGDLIISRANTLELVGAIVRVSENYPLRLLSDKTLRLVVNEDKLLPDYLLTVLKWPEARTYIENNATGTSDSMRNISQKTINTIPVPMLSKKQQREIISHSKAVNDELFQIQQATKQVLIDIALLPQKILAQAFEI
jgi:type I restriction enzyme, S subunit